MPLQITLPELIAYSGEKGRLDRTKGLSGVFFSPACLSSTFCSSQAMCKELKQPVSQPAQPLGARRWAELRPGFRNSTT